MGAHKIVMEQALNKEIATFMKQSNLYVASDTRKKAISYDEFLSDKMLIIMAIRAGIPYSLFKLIQTHF